VAVYVVTLEFELERETLCDVATVLFGAKTKLNELGFAEIVLAGPVEFALSVTGTDRIVVPERILMKPTSTPEVGAPAPMDTVRTKGVVPVEGVTANQPLSE
jgi:hypothetical protein